MGLPQRQPKNSGEIVQTFLKDCALVECSVSKNVFDVIRYLSHHILETCKFLFQAF